VAIARTGSLSTFTDSVNQSSTSVTVPADAEMMVVGVSGYYNQANWFTTEADSLKLGASTFNEVAFDGNTNMFMGAIFWIDCRSLTGSQTLAWNWGGTSVTNGVAFIYGFYKGMDWTASPIRDSDGVQDATMSSGSPGTTKTLTAQTGDLIIAIAEAYHSGGGAVFTWGNATKQLDFDDGDTATIGWAEAAPTGNQTVTAYEAFGGDGGLGAIVIKPAGGATAIPTADSPVLAIAESYRAAVALTVAEY
jgi:hypothetical protein